MCTCVCVEIRVNLAVSCSSGGCLFLVSLDNLSNFLFPLFSPPAFKEGQEMAFSLHQYPTHGQRVSNSLLFLACPIYHRNEAVKIDLALSDLSV